MAASIVGVLGASPLHAQGRPFGGGAGIDTIAYLLARTERGYELRYWNVGGPMVRKSIPGDWLATDGEPGAGPFEAGVTAFALDAHRVGLHLMAYRISTEGTSATALGRDAVLVLDRNTDALAPLAPPFGVTRGRTHAAGCWQAWDVTILVGDVNRDGIRDIGVIRRRLSCDIPEAGVPSLPSYREAPVHWWVSGGGAWAESDAYDGRLPPGYLRVPARALHKSPVDWVLERLRGRP